MLVSRRTFCHYWFPTGTLMDFGFSCVVTKGICLTTRVSGSRSVASMWSSQWWASSRSSIYLIAITTCHNYHESSYHFNNYLCVLVIVSHVSKNKKAVLSQRWPRNALYIRVPWKFSQAALVLALTLTVTVYLSWIWTHHAYKCKVHNKASRRGAIVNS